MKAVGNKVFFHDLDELRHGPMRRAVGKPATLMVEENLAIPNQNVIHFMTFAVARAVDSAVGLGSDEGALMIRLSKMSRRWVSTRMPR